METIQVPGRIISPAGRPAPICSNQTGKEDDEAGQTLEDDKMDFTIRYSSETAAIVSTKYRILLNDRIYNIDHIDDMGFKRHSLKFHATLARK